MRSPPIKVRTGQAPKAPLKADFLERFRDRFTDSTFGPERAALDRIGEIAWSNYQNDRKAPDTRPAGKGFANPKYELSTEWRATRDTLRAAERVQRASATRSRALVIIGSPRTDGSCPGEMSKSARLAAMVADELQRARVEVDTLDLSLVTSKYNLHIHPCKGCASTAMPLCHWPCSCYPNHAMGQTGDWMAEIYERWVAAHAVVMVTPVHWYQSPSVLKLMIDRLVCADGGNPDPTLTDGKDATLAKKIELQGWDYPKHLAGRLYGLVVHGDVAGIEGTRRALSDWLDWMGLIDAGSLARLDRYIGYYEPYATSHDALDRDRAVQQEVRNVGRAVAVGIRALRSGKLLAADKTLRSPRPK